VELVRLGALGYTDEDLARRYGRCSAAEFKRELAQPENESALHGLREARATALEVLLREAWTIARDKRATGRLRAIDWLVHRLGVGSETGAPAAGIDELAPLAPEEIRARLLAVREIQRVRLECEQNGRIAEEAKS